MIRTLFASVLLIGVVPTVVISRQSTPTIYELGDGVIGPSIVNPVEPTYTPQARASGVQGFVYVAAVVRENGTVRDARVVQSRLWSSTANRGNRREAITFLTDAEVAKLGLGARALDAAEQWTFKPGTRDGEPVPVRITMEIRFTLQPAKQRR
jgi:hypothetical protein